VLYRDLEGNNHTALLNGNPGSEVIVAAGALGSPQLLMLSGVGPAEELAAWNISVVVDNPAVGARMADNPINSLWVMTNQQVEVTLIQVVGITAFGSYIEVSSGIAEVSFCGSYSGV
jgi:choline dehydrogenase